VRLLHPTIRFLLLLLFLNGFAQTKLPAIFGDHMILQQQADAAIWGTDEPGTEVLVRGNWGSEALSVADADGNWKVYIKTPEAGGPYTVDISGTAQITYKNVLIGEVWFCSGQSNMFMKLRGFYGQPINGGNDAILNSRNPKIRLFHVERNASLEPLDDLSGQWSEADPEATSDFSATAYFFGKRLYDVLGIPVGLIHSSWGSATAEAWMNSKYLAAFPNLKMPEAIPERVPQTYPTLLYNAMLHPLLGYTIKGAIWYQGEGNRNRPEQYEQLFPAMIANWRNDWNQGDFPFYFVQIAPFRYGGLNGAYLRHAQMKTIQTVPNTGMAVITDIGECNDIHPKEKRIVGERLALWALAKDYQLGGFAYSGPIYRRMEKKDAKIILYFDHAAYGFTSYRKPVEGFEIAGSDKVFREANVRFGRDGSLEVWSDDVATPEAARYGFSRCGTGNLFNVAGLPVSPFRTDSWDIEEVEAINK
jgi:sialate O-acetylesterase